MKVISNLLFFILISCSLLLAKGQVNCVTDSSDASCTNFQYPLANITADINSLCVSMPYMPVCTIQQSCNEASSTSGICAPFSILGDSCLHDMPGMNGCSNFKKLCASGSVVEQCSSVDSISNLPTTMQLFAGIKSICTEMAMDGCEKCSGNSPTTTCDVLPVYSSLCMAMPDMSQCANWTKMCSSSGQLYDSEITSDYCVASVTDAVPIMRMYFHTGILDYILFKSWVPRTDRQFAGSWFAIFFFAIFFELEKTLRSILEKRWTPKKKDSDDDSNLISSSLLGGSYPKFSYRDIIRGCLHAIELTCSYALMLVAMTFNVALFFAVIAGVLVGNILFGRYRNYTPRVTCCE